MREALDIQVKGIVQGVGFRPFVYRLARRYLIDGWVLNAVEGVFIHAEGEAAHIDGFVMEISDNAPAAAKVERIFMKEAPLERHEGFEIRCSDDSAAESTTLVSPYLGLCDECCEELFDPANRRYRYPFINCTNCGPRFTIIDGLPYDRSRTSMAGFLQCGPCAAEYADPADRRFHAQPNACFDCGPHVSWYEGSSTDDLGVSEPGAPRAAGFDSPSTLENAAGDAAACVSFAPLDSGGVFWARDREESDRVFARAVAYLAAGKIVAVKGLGGFHLVCDASNEQALARLRERKRRDGKAFAVMMPSIDAIRAFCAVNDAEEALLAAPARPIVLLEKLPGAPLAAGLADRLPELGVMLPATPVQYLLLNDFFEATGKSMLVMTSGNVHDEPIAIDDAEARRVLAQVADAFLGNDRPVRARYDDSVVRVLRTGGVDESGAPETAVQFLRRARGYAPVPLAFPLPTEEPQAVGGFAAARTCLFAAGSEQKNTFTFVRGTEAFVSQHIGDMENAETYDAWFAAKRTFERLFELVPTRLACDAHPEYLPSKWAREQGMPLEEVQHHHAHIASVIGEHGIEGAVCGIAFDGTGYGADGTIWGGEVLLANRSDFERFANFAYVPMPGGAAAVRHPQRMAYGVLWAFDLLDHPGARTCTDALGEQASVCAQLVERGLNAPLTSSVGRLFDAAAALLGLAGEASYEGEPAIVLDAARAGEDERAEDARPRYAVQVTKNAASPTSTAHDTSVVLFDAAPTFRALLDDKEAGVEVGVIALRFHEAFVGAILTAAELVRTLYDIDTVALSGGVFMNRFLAEESLARLGAAGFTVAVNGNLPPNDGCISFGQAVVACARR